MSLQKVKESKQAADNEQNQILEKISWVRDNLKLEILSSFGLPTGLTVPDIVLEELEAHLLATKGLWKVPICCLHDYLNKSDVPVIIVGAITTIIFGTMLPIYVVLLSKFWDLKVIVHYWLFHQNPNSFLWLSIFWSSVSDQFISLGLFRCPKRCGLNI